jgi:hypothetical protein
VEENATTGGRLANRSATQPRPPCDSAAPDAARAPWSADLGKINPRMAAGRARNVRRRALFMTATQRRYKGSSDQILSMDDATICGETVDLLSFKEAIAAKPPILSDYEVLVLGVGRKKIASLTQTPPRITK